MANSDSITHFTVTLMLVSERFHFYFHFLLHIHSFALVCYRLLHNLWFLYGSSNGDIHDYIFLVSGRGIACQQESMALKLKYWTDLLLWQIFVQSHWISPGD